MLGSGSSLPTAVPRLGDRALFPELEARAYLAHAAISPVSVVVQAAIVELLTDYARRGVFAFGAWAEQRFELRQSFACLLGVEPSAIALTPGTTRGISDVALAIPWRSGDRILCFRGEFPANVTPWQRVAERFGVELVWLDADAFRLDPPAALADLDRVLDGGVRLVAVSAVEFQTGFRLPLVAIGERCRTHGAFFAVDAVQACGVVPTEARAWQADFVACGAHKWLMGLEGGGLLYVRPERAEELVPATAGWLSHEHGADFLFRGAGRLRYDRPLKRGAEVFEGATLPATVFAGLGTSIRLLLELGIDAIEGHVTAYLDRLEPALVGRGFQSLRAVEAAGRSGILAVVPPAGRDPVALQRELAARGVITSVPDGLLRFAPHWPNSLAEVPEVVAAVDAALEAISRGSTDPSARARALSRL
ncbi:MAG: aminotransferase class V-fold PLP-dependent enzyme [Polyangiaceae bacterium]|nr:aminotransferase class V-fold PLP-dependent enzyme [Polyangiaceae bacterium]